MESWDISSLQVEPHHPRVLRSDDEARIIAINLPAGERLQQHQTYERAYLVVVEGAVEVVDGAESIPAGPGFLAHFEPNERREVRATADARILLILGPWPGDGHYTAHQGEQ